MARDKEDDRDSTDNDGMRPDELEGPGDAEASPDRCEFKSTERSEGPSESQFEMADQLHEEFPLEEIPVVIGPDGLPKPVTPEPDDSVAIPFTYETQLCIEDDREYAELFNDELEERGWGYGGVDVSIRKTPAGGTVRHVEVRSRYDAAGKSVLRRTFTPDSVIMRWGSAFVAGEGGTLIPVRPRRERCRHYRRQVFNNESQSDPALPGHQLVFRLCAARRSNGGAYMSISNEAVYACDFRDPVDVPSARLQDGKDKKKLVDRPDLLRLPLFNLDGDVVQLEHKS